MNRYEPRIPKASALGVCQNMISSAPLILKWGCAIMCGVFKARSLGAKTKTKKDKINEDIPRNSG